MTLGDRETGASAMLKRVLAVTGAAAGAVLLSGCVALELPLAAVTADADGVPLVLIRPCDDDPYEDPTLSGWAGAHEDEPSEDEADTTVWEAAGEWSGAEEFPLFSPPASWGVEAGDERRPRSGHTYRFVFYSQTDDDANGTVMFTTADLRRLKPGQVWADDRAMSLEEFEELAEKSC
ncbi:hypothetical protein ACSCB1_13970 [Streptomyces europaeiscabiei]|nr:hypothetical protein [Streptomyces europaeiscabiei]MDX3548048.1 hypothetical protein [Streptomyces europaeiscabiei]MDX3555967.1 hypothetical protein [Streptomyces europaeiscabiei]